MLPSHEARHAGAPRHSTAHGKAPENLPRRRQALMNMPGELRCVPGHSSMRTHRELWKLTRGQQQVLEQAAAGGARLCHQHGQRPLAPSQADWRSHQCHVVRRLRPLQPPHPSQLVLCAPPPARHGSSAPAPGVTLPGNMGPMRVDWQRACSRPSSPARMAETAQWPKQLAGVVISMCSSNAV